MKSPRMESVGFQEFTITSTARGGCPKQRTGSAPVPARVPSPGSAEVMTDFRSYGLMEERYGIQDEGLF